MKIGKRRKVEGHVGIGNYYRYKKLIQEGPQGLETTGSLVGESQRDNGRRVVW